MYAAAFILLKVYQVPLCGGLLVSNLYLVCIARYNCTSTCDCDFPVICAESTSITGLIFPPSLQEIFGPVLTCYVFPDNEADDIMKLVSGCGLIAGKWWLWHY